MPEGNVADPLSMSLDDVIAQSKSKLDAERRPRAGRQGRGSGSFSSRGRRDQRDRPGSRQASGNLRVRVSGSEGIRKPFSRPRGGRTFAGELDEPAHIKQAKLEGDLGWAHDKSEGRAPRRQPVPIAAPAPVVARAPAGSSKLVVSNLDQNVSDEDIKELFGSMGDLKQCAINYDRQGISQGTANVEFAKDADATKALQEFNGVHLDGKPMHINQIMKEPDSLSSGVRVTRPAAAEVRSVPASRLGGLFMNAMASAGRDSSMASRRGRGFGGAAMDTDAMMQ